MFSQRPRITFCLTLQSSIWNFLKKEHRNDLFEHIHHLFINRFMINFKDIFKEDKDNEKDDFK